MTNERDIDPASSGWLKLHRRIRHNPMWYAEPLTQAHAWLDLLIMASYEDSYREVKNRTVWVQKGQVLTTIGYLAEQWKWSKSKILRRFEKWESLQQIERRTEQGITLITICNYGTFNSSKKGGDTSDDTPPDTPNEPVGESSADTSGESHIKKAKKINKKNTGAGAHALSRSAPHDQHSNRSTVLQSEWAPWLVDEFGFSDSAANDPSTIQTYVRWELELIKKPDVRAAINEYQDRHGRLPDTPSEIEAAAKRHQFARLKSETSPTLTLVGARA